MASNEYYSFFFFRLHSSPGGSMSYVVGLPNNSHKPITNTAWVSTQLFELQKGCTRLTAVTDKVYQLLAHGRWFSPVTPASSTTETGRHDIAEILLKVALSTINQIKSIKSNYIHVLYLIPHTILTRRSRFFFFLNGVKNNYQSFLKSHTCAFVIITRPF